MSFLEIRGKRTIIGTREQIKRDGKEHSDRIRNQVLKFLLRAREKREKRAKETDGSNDEEE